MKNFGSARMWTLIALVLLWGGVSKAASARTIAIVSTDASVATFGMPVDYFKAAVEDAMGELKYIEYDMKNDHRVAGPQVIERIKADRPDLIFALGNIAAFLVKRDIPDIPAVFTLVLNWPRYELETDSMTGVAMEVPESILFQQFKLVAPGVATLGMIYNPESTAQVVDRARAAAAELGIELVAVEAKGRAEVIPALRALAGRANGFWMHADPSLYIEEVPEQVIATCNSLRLPLMAPTESFVDAGALTAISWSYPNLGAQAGSVAVAILRDGQSPGSIPVADPIGTTFVINADTAAAIGLELDALLFVFADRVIRSDGL